MLISYDEVLSAHNLIPSWKTTFCRMLFSINMKLVILHLGKNMDWHIRQYDAEEDICTQEEESKADLITFFKL
jgi:hypothetical protein